MFTYAPRLVQQRAAQPVYDRTPSQFPPSVPRSRTPSFHHFSPVPQPIPTRHSQTPSPQSIPAAVPRHSPELWVDALKEDVEAEFNLSLVDDVKAVKDAALASATTPEEKVAIQREYNESMADIRALARAELQRRVEAERERRLLGNFHGKDAIVAEQQTILDNILRENMRGDASYSLPSSSSLPQQHPLAQPQPQISRQSQPIQIPMKRNSSRNGVPRRGSVGGRSVSIGNGPIASSSTSSPRAFPSARRDSITQQHASARPFQPPTASPASSLSSIAGPSELSSSSSSSVGSTHDKNAGMDRRYQEHRAAVQKREKEVQLKEAAALRYAEEARRREEAAARHEEHARRKNEEATRRIHEAELREQQLRAWEARTRKEIAQKEAGPSSSSRTTRVRALSTASASVPRMTPVLPEEWQQLQQLQQQRLRAGAGVPSIPSSIAVPRGEVKVRF